MTSDGWKTGSASSTRGGTRGVAVLAVQVQQIAQDVARLEQAMTKDVARLERRLEATMAEHSDAHDAERAGRMNSRRWIVGAVIALIAAIDGPLVTVLLHLH